MSRTDAHAPLHVRLVRGDLTAHPFHADVHDVCDLPPLQETAPYGSRATGCFWAFFFTGVEECPCPSCHGGWAARARNRAERHQDRAALGTALGAWRGGDGGAFDALIPPPRYR